MLKPVPNKLDLPALDRELLEFWKHHKIFEKSLKQSSPKGDFVFYDGPPGTNGVPHIGHMMQSALKDLWPKYKTMQGYRVIRKAGWDTHGLPVELTADKELGLKSKLDVVGFGEQKYIDYCRKTVFRYKGLWEDAIRKVGRFVDLDNAYATYQPYYIQSDWWTLKQAWNLELQGEARALALKLGQSPRYLYRDYRVMAFSPRTGTTLSNFEVAQGYKEVTDLTLYVKFRVKTSDPKDELYLTAWTTTPWTLFSNLAIAVNPKIEYSTIEIQENFKYGKAGERWILATARIEPLRSRLGKFRVIKSQLGSELAGMRYRPMWDWLNFLVADETYVRQPEVTQLTTNQEHRPLFGSSSAVCSVIADDYVTDKDGTGLVHLAPYGEDDHRILKKNEIGIFLAVESDGRVSNIVTGFGLVDNGKGELVSTRLTDGEQFVGSWFREEGLDDKIWNALKEKNLLVGQEKYTHAYPFDYRTGFPLMYFPRPAWFIRTTALRDMMMEANTLIGWKPDHIRDGRFGNWLENIADWNVTRERFWGSPLPIWTTGEPKLSDRFELCLSSLSDVKQAVIDCANRGFPVIDHDPKVQRAFTEKFTLTPDQCMEMYKAGKFDSPLPPQLDLHKPEIDWIILWSPDGRRMYRENFVLDSWFNAGLMPWGQYGYPAEPGSDIGFRNQYPADFICEGLDQTRGWFYTLLACSCLVAKGQLEKAKQDGNTDELKFWSNPRNWSSYKNVICTELVLDHQGQKMSKSVGNVVDPIALFDKFGADPVRWIFYSSNPWNAKRFGEEEIADAVRMVILPLWDSYSFFVTYALIDGWNGTDGAKIEPTLMDRWIISEYHHTVAKVTKSLDEFDVAGAASAIERFLDLLTNWYIRRSRRRFWKSESDSDKATAYATLHEVLVGLSHLLAPFLPFLSEMIYQNLEVNTHPQAKESVHLSDFPVDDPSKRDLTLEAQMDTLQTGVTLARALRQERNLKVRQPLSSLTWVIPGESREEEMAPFLQILADELNVKTVKFRHDDSDLVTLSATANFKMLGKKVGGRMKEVAAEILKMTPAEIKTVEAGGIFRFEDFEFTSEDILIKRSECEGFALKSDGHMTVALDTHITQDLAAEGMAREVVHHIQNLRKQSGLEITDRIQIEIDTQQPELEMALNSFREYICRETLAQSLELNNESGGQLRTNVHGVELDSNGSRFEVWLDRATAHSSFTN